MMLTARDRLSLAQGFSVRGSSIRRRFEQFSATPDTPPTRFQSNELPPPRRGLRLVELERARREQQEHGTLDR
jgi:hypothetical protein